tara:strand:+ start:262 stop:723 length:462 start_codon:yes stop_codon:yes gene_type:complete
MFAFFKNHKIYLLFIFFILIGCQLQEPTKNHGIVFLENRSNKLMINKNNKNDIIKIIGRPHATSFKDTDTWIYIERTLTKGSFHKLGQNVLKNNNVLILSFDKYGILKEKNFLDKEMINEIKFSKKATENDLSRKSFVQSFLSSVKAKMYGNK